MSNEEILQLFNACTFDGVLTENDFEDKVLSNLPDDLKYHYEYGATKLVIMLPDCDFVIKIPFSGSYQEFYQDRTDDYEEEYVEFENADFETCEWDYCKTEVNRYNLAKNVGIEKYFAKTECIGMVNNYPIYIQQKAEIFAEVKDLNSYSEEKKSSTREKCDKEDLWCFNECWLSDLLDYCGDRIFSLFMSFLKDNEFDDLHSSNIGYINGVPVLVDYSGFND